jgi:hypothetical protein
MTRAIALLPAACAAALVATTAAASAAQIAVDRSCFADPGQRKDNIALTGSGFSPSGAYQVTLDGAALTGGAGTTDAAGALTGSFVAPSLDDVVGKGTFEHTFTLGVTEGANAPTTQFTVSKLLATFKPSSGDPKSLKVRFSMYGFGLSGAVSPTIYLHYVRPNGKLRKTYKLGNTQGPCGSLTTAKRHLFPFAAQRGAWKLQFDTSPAYTKGVKTSTFLFYTLGVTVKPKK